MAEKKGLFPSGSEFSGWLPGLIVCIIFAWLVINFTAVVKGLGKGFFLNKYHINSYVLYLLIAGMIIRNTVGIPKSLQNGVNISRAIIKPGIILLGAHYMWGQVIKAGVPAVTLVVLFVFGTALGVMVLSKKYGVPDSLAGLMGAGVGICGVSAIIATGPVVRARPQDLFYAIATILLFGTVMLFVLPAIGIALNMEPHIFGAWVATTILNTAQLTAAAALYDSAMQTGAGVPALVTATLINIARVIFIPIVVLFAIWFYIVRPAGEGEVEVGKVVKEKFPVFVLGFFGVVILNSIGAFGQAEYVPGKVTRAPMSFLLGKVMMKWFFAVGFAGIGLNIVWEDMKKAGGAAFGIGVIAAIFKGLFSLAVIYAMGVETLTFV
jgi:uncharacterized integral membrane protein (TIGR00698 family)